MTIKKRNNPKETIEPGMVVEALRLIWLLSGAGLS